MFEEDSSGYKDKWIASSEMMLKAANSDKIEIQNNNFVYDKQKWLMLWKCYLCNIVQTFSWCHIDQQRDSSSLSNQKETQPHVSEIT